MTDKIEPSVEVEGWSIRGVDQGVIVFLTDDQKAMVQQLLVNVSRIAVALEELAK